MKRRIVVLLTVVLMVLATFVSSSPGFSQPPTPPGIEKLRQDADGEVEITWNPSIGTPSFIRGRIPLQPAYLKEKADPATVALSFVEYYGEVFGLRDPRAELEAVEFVTDELGMTHVTLRQVYQGIEVYNAQMKVHLSADGKEVVAVSSGFVPGIALPSVKPQVSADQALTMARTALPKGELTSGPNLVVYPGATGGRSGASARLVWLVELRDDWPPADNVYVVDATEGIIVDVLNRLYQQIPLPATPQVSEEESIRAEVDRQISLAAEGVLGYLVYQVQVENVTIQGDWATVLMSFVDRVTGERVSIEPAWAIAHKEQRKWQVAIPSAPDWRKLLGDVPEPLLSASIKHKQLSLERAMITPTTTQISGFKLPWPSEISHSLSRSVAHIEPPYGSPDELYAFDFSDSSNPNFDISAARGGTVLAAQWHYPNGYEDGDCSHANYLVIKDTSTSPTAYALYLHLAQDSVPERLRTIGAPVVHGEFIGRADDTGCSTGNHLHFQVHTAATWWSTTVDVTFEDVNINGGRPRTCDEANKYPQYGTQCRNSYISGNTPPRRDRKTYDANHTCSLPGTLVRSEDQGPTGDRDVDNAHDFAGDTYDYYYHTHGRDSFDDRGATLTSTVHYCRNYQNAFWNGEQTVYGDDFPVKDVVAHEWTHAVTQYTANLEYRYQCGSLNESFSDIFGAMVDRDDWEMGEDLPSGAVRDLCDPTRFEQPDHTKDFVCTCTDNCGVHINSGITNKAYCNIATNTDVGKEKAERIFYRVLTVHLHPTSSLEDARAAALQATWELSNTLGYTAVYTTVYNAVLKGFNDVGLDGVWQPPSYEDCCGWCSTVGLSAEPDGCRLADTIRAVRDKVFTQDPGRRWVRIYYEHQFEVEWLLISDSQLRANAAAGFRAFGPVFRAGLGEGPTVTLTPELIEAARRALMGVAERGSPALRDDIVREWEKVDPYRFVGWDVRKVWEQLCLEEQSEWIYLPIVLK